MRHYLVTSRWKQKPGDSHSVSSGCHVGEFPIAAEKGGDSGSGVDLTGTEKRPES